MWNYIVQFCQNNKDSERWKRGWKLARIIASQLQNKFAAKRVIVFGSLLDFDEFHSDSDIDLAVAGIPSEKFYQAVASVTGLSGEFKVDLVDIEDCLPQLRQVIESEGMPL